MKNKIEDLRNHLFETLEALRDKEAPMEIARAKAICDVAGQIIDSAKVEVEYAAVTGARSIGSGFIPLPPPEDPPAPDPSARRVTQFGKKPHA